MSTELWAEGPHHIGTPTVVETSAKQMSDETPEARPARPRAKLIHTMSCEYPEGCSCGAKQYNSLIDELNNAARENAQLRAKLASGQLTVIADGGEWTKEDAIAALNQRTIERDEAREKLASAEMERDDLRAIARQTQIEKEAAEELVQVLRRIDQRFGCNHADQGADDADNIARHVNELFDERDAAIARAEEAEADVKGLDHGLIEMFKKCTRVESERDELRREVERLQSELSSIKSKSP